MRSDVKYVKNDKVYKVKQKAWRPRRVTLWLLLPLVLVLALGGYCVYNAFSSDSEGLSEYKVQGDIDYKVYLKDNDYYTEKYLEKGMQYIASLIKVVSADFDYEFAADDDAASTYDYKVVADLRVTDRSDKSKVMYENAEDLLKKEDLKIENGIINIHENVNIDYAKYNDYVRNFRNEFGLAANCELNLKLVVNVEGEIDTEDTLAMVIPLSEQTVDIKMDTQGVTRTEKVGDEETTVYVKNYSMLIVGIIVIVTSLILMVAVVYYYVTRFNDNLYEKSLHKILKEYDTYIVEASDTIYETEDVVKVPSFKELLDAQALENTPIVFLEVEPGKKSYFIVNGAKTTFRYTLSKAYQDKLQHDGEKEF